MVELEHLDENCQEVVNQTGTKQWNIMLWAHQNHKIKILFMGDIILWFPKGERNTPKSSKNDGLVHVKYIIVFPIILYYLSALTCLNQIPFW
jgi:hypothetical protein